MARFTKEQLDSFDDFDDVISKKLSPAARKAAESEAENELAALRAMQDSLSQAIAGFMSSESIGIVELTKRLETSSRQTSRIMNAEANVTLATLARIAAVMGMQPRIVFERPAKKGPAKTRRKKAPTAAAARAR